jgi:hypothetical protein
MLSNFKPSSEVKIEKKIDSVGGGSFLLDSNLYPFRVDVAYIDKSSFGSTNLEIRYVGTGENKKAYRETIALTDNDGNSEVKDKNGVLRPFFGMTKANALLNILTGKDIHELESEEKIVELFDFDAGGMAKVPRQVIPELKGLPIKLGVTMNRNNKKMKDDVTGKWVDNPDGSIKEVNKTHTAFRFEDDLTASEIEHGATEAKFLPKWLETFEGTVQGKVRTVVGGATAGVPGAPAGGELKFD